MEAASTTPTTMLHWALVYYRFHTSSLVTYRAGVSRLYH